MKDKLLKIISFYGIDKQLKYIHSEYFELDEAVINAEYNRYIGIIRKPCEGAINHIAEEIADVMVMLKQFQYYYGISDEEIEKIMQKKIDRQLDRIEEEKMMKK
jgi:NTP pyrophosphatase (non-canonical NTP hydrolase)